MTPRAATLVLAATVALALGVSAAVHLALAVPFSVNRGALIDQGMLFRIQAALDALAAVAVAVLPGRTTAVAAGALAFGGAVILAVTAVMPLDGTALGLPYLYEPIWYPAKVTALVTQLVAALAAAAMLRPWGPSPVARRA